MLRRKSRLKGDWPVSKSEDGGASQVLEPSAMTSAINMPLLGFDRPPSASLHHRAGPAPEGQADQFTRDPRRSCEAPTPFLEGPGKICATTWKSPAMILGAFEYVVYCERQKKQIATLDRYGRQAALDVEGEMEDRDH